MVSDDPEFVKDDLVEGFVHWGEYTVVKGGMLRKLDPEIDLPLSYHAGVLGNQSPNFIFLEKSVITTIVMIINWSFMLQE